MTETPTGNFTQIMGGHRDHDDEGRLFFQSLPASVQERLRQAVNKRENPAEATLKFLRQINIDEDRKPTAGISLDEVVSAIEQRAETAEGRAEQARADRERAALSTILSTNGIAHSSEQLAQLDNFLVAARMQRGRHTGPLS